MLYFNFKFNVQIGYSKNFRFKTDKAELYNYKNWSWYSKKRERELDGAYGFPLVKSEIYTKFALKWCTHWKVLNFMFEISIWSSFWYYIWNLYKIVAAGTTG